MSNSASVTLIVTFQIERQRDLDSNSLLLTMIRIDIEFDWLSVGGLIVKISFWRPIWALAAAVIPMQQSTLF
jgi:hypothetical protein